MSLSAQVHSQEGEQRFLVASCCMTSLPMGLRPSAQTLHQESWGGEASRDEDIKRSVA